MLTNRRLLMAIVFLSLVFMGLDWSRLILHPADLEVSPLSNALKVGVSFLATVIAWRARNHGLSSGDEKAFRILFSLVFVADVCFVVGLAPVGIVLFAIFQGLLAKRNLTGWKAAKVALARNSALLGGVALGVAASLGATLFGIYKLQGITPLLFVIAVYVTFLWASVVSAWAARAIGHFPDRNTGKMALGMLLFLCCDVTVAGNLALPPESMARVVTSSLTWLFYAPALVLIALSAWRNPAVPLALDVPEPIASVK